MKVNERCLIHIAQSDDNPTDQSGWLHLFHEDKKLFQKKWFILKENLLFYYNHKFDKEPSGVIILDGYRVEIIESIMDMDRFAFKIDFGLNRFGQEMRSYILYADSHSEMEAWIKALSCASYDYLKMVVSELQHRLDEMNKSSINDDHQSTKRPSSKTSNGSIINNDQQSTTSSSSSSLSLHHSNNNRFNPFDQSTKILTFSDLHEKYAKEIQRLQQK